MYTHKLRITATVLAFAALGLSSGATFAAEPATPVDSGRAVTDDSPYGAYLWHNENGWHFRTHGVAQGTRFTARISTNGMIRDVAAVRDEKDDHINLDAGGHALDLSFATYSGVDGVDFRLDDPRWLRVNVEANEQQLPVDNIFLGDDGRHPEKNPFVLHLRDLRVPEDLQTGYTVLREADRLMLLTHDREGSHQYTGTLTTTGRIEIVDLVRPEKDDSASVSADGHTVSFKLSTQEGVDGLVVRVTGAEKLQLTLDTDGALSPVSSIHLGVKGRSPIHNPFDLKV